MHALHTRLILSMIANEGAVHFVILDMLVVNGNTADGLQLTACTKLLTRRVRSLEISSRSGTHICVLSECSRHSEDSAVRHPVFKKCNHC